MEPTKSIKETSSDLDIRRSAFHRFPKQRHCRIIVSIFVLTFSFFLYGGATFIPVDMFSAYIDGMERARELNWRDQQRYLENQRRCLELQRVELILNAKRNYLETGDLAYLCIAASYGDDFSMRILYLKDIECIFK
ncbi:MAG: hypothetical protein LBD41_01865 [Clostridiales Family XIII bacterium]|jgi:hypothetical protein|nr:hypothetical protein [Clostridiales Family XIII bacterium]